MKWVVPEERLKSVTFPSAPTGTVTEFGTVWPAAKFKFEAFGRAVPEA